MPKIETYVATATKKTALALAATTSPFAIEVRFLGGLTAKQKDAFKAAADRWTRVIVGDLPSVMVDGEVIDDILITAQGQAIDGPGKILGQAGPSRLRPASAGAAAFLPAKGKMAFDKADLKKMEQDGTLNDVITHEMGHVLGIGTIWDLKGLLTGAGTSNPTFTGAGAKIEFGKLKGTAATVVPVENTGGPGTADGHWRETVFRNELMTGFVGKANNPPVNLHRDKIQNAIIIQITHVNGSQRRQAWQQFARPELAAPLIGKHMQLTLKKVIVCAVKQGRIRIPVAIDIRPHEVAQSGKPREWV